MSFLESTYAVYPESMMNIVSPLSDQMSFSSYGDVPVLAKRTF